MIILILYESNKEKQLMVSHGWNTDTDRIVILPNLPLFCFDYKYDLDIGEYILK